MAIMGWIVWGFACILATVLLCIVVKEFKGNVPLPFRRNLRALLLELLTLVGILISLYVTIAREVSRIHLLWLIPASFGAASVLGGLVIIVLEPFRLRWYRKAAFKEMNPSERESNDRFPELHMNNEEDLEINDG